MNEPTETVTEANAEGVSDKASTLVDTIFDIGLSWAEFGVGQGKRASRRAPTRWRRSPRRSPSSRNVCARAQPRAAPDTLGARNHSTR